MRNENVSILPSKENQMDFFEREMAGKASVVRVCCTASKSALR